MAGAKKNSKKKQTASWRGIQQPKRPTRKTAAPIKAPAQASGLWGNMKLRMAAAVLAAVCAVGLLTVGVWGIAQAGKQLGSQLNAPIKNWQVRSNGVLQFAELKGRVASLGSQNASLATIHLEALQQELKSLKQIKHVTARKLYPDTLVIDITERIPVARLRVASTGGGASVRLIDAAGVVYAGQGYPEATLNALPFLAGVKLIFNERVGNYEPLAVMPTVAELLTTLRRQAPGVYGQTILVNCSKFKAGNLPWEVIALKTSGMGTLKFAPKNFSKQINQLRSILGNIHEADHAFIAHIDLTVPGQGAVKFNRASAGRRAVRGR